MALDILIAEDEPSILESLDFILRRAGYTISAVTDGDAVLEAVRRLSPRMVVLDVMLPKRSGFICSISPSAISACHRLSSIFSRSGCC